MRIEDWYALTARLNERRDRRRDEARAVVIDMLCVAAVMCVLVLLAWVCCAVSGYRWE